MLIWKYIAVDDKKSGQKSYMSRIDERDESTILNIFLQTCLKRLDMGSCVPIYVSFIFMNTLILKQLTHSFFYDIKFSNKTGLLDNSKL